MGMHQTLKTQPNTARFPTFPPDLPPHPQLSAWEAPSNLPNAPAPVAALSDQTHPLTHPSRVQISGFVAGTMIETTQGPVAVETLRPGARILTLEDGPQALGWVGQRSFAAADAMGPVTIAPGAVGNREVLCLSPGCRIDLPQGVSSAGELVEGSFVQRTPAEAATYFALQFDAPHTILAAGAQIRIGGPSVLSFLDRGSDRQDRMSFV